MKKVGIILGILALVLVLSGCGKSVSEKAVEKAIEAQSGGKANVDINSGNVKVETEEGMMESGTDVKLPSDFPSDVFVIDGEIKAAISDQASGGFTISIETEKTVEEVNALYKEKLESEGWKITATMNFSGMTSTTGEKDDRTVSVAISKAGSDTKTNAVVSAIKQQN